MSTSDIRPNGVAPHPTTTQPTTSNDPDAIRQDIERTREELAETVDALHAKLDVKTQARERVARMKEQATTETGKPRPEVVAAVVAAVLLVAGLVWWRKG
jgi:cobalamin biosynthesis Mg chelatase CobN